MSNLVRKKTEDVGLFHSPLNKLVTQSSSCSYDLINLIALKKFQLAPSHTTVNLRDLVLLTHAAYVQVATNDFVGGHDEADTHLALSECFIKKTTSLKTGTPVSKALKFCKMKGRLLQKWSYASSIEWIVMQTVQLVYSCGSFYAIVISCYYNDCTVMTSPNEDALLFFVKLLPPLFVVACLIIIIIIIISFYEHLSAEHFLSK